MFASVDTFLKAERSLIAIDRTLIFHGSFQIEYQSVHKFTCIYYNFILQSIGIAIVLFQTSSLYFIL